MITYKLKKGGDIECTGYTSTFKLEDLKSNIERSEKYVKEFASNIEVKDAILANILEHNSFVRKMTPEMIHACFMYHEAMAYKTTYENKLKEFKAAVRKDKAELKEILAQIPELNKEDEK